MNTANPHTTRAVRQKAGRLVTEAVKASTCAKVAEMLGVGRPTCHRWSTGARLPHAMYVARILGVLS